MPVPHVDSPFLVGIDLGTTNCACAFVDLRQAGAQVELFQIPQLTHPFIVAPQPMLPSFLYFGDAHEIENASDQICIAHPEWEWADLDRGRLVWAEAGVLYAAAISPDGLEPRKELYDFTPMRFEALVAPYGP